MNRFVIVNELPYLYAHGKTYSVRWDEAGFTVGTEVELASVPDRTYSELSIKAKCANHLDSITATKQTDPELEKLTLEKLKEYADANGFDIGGAKTKAAIIEAINAAKEQAVS